MITGIIIRSEKYYKTMCHHTGCEIGLKVDAYIIPKKDGFFLDDYGYAVKKKGNFLSSVRKT